MTQLLSILVPELILTAAAGVLFMLGCFRHRGVRTVAPFLAMAAVVLVFLVQIYPGTATGGAVSASGDDRTSSIRIDNLGYYIRLISAGIAVVLLLLAWPSRADQQGNSALRYGDDGPEFYGLFLLSLAGLMLTAVSNDLIVLFLALELVSIPTYVMVSISRPAAVAQEAGVKYFFLGALSVALMLFGFSYLYGATGEINFAALSDKLAAATKANGGVLPAWELLAILLIVVGFAFKMAAFPLHFYAGDVYEGAATPVTAFLAFVPKTAGFVALIKLLFILGGAQFDLPPKIVTLLWVLSALTMTVGNVLALLQNNVKRVLAYSSIAHSGYMLVGLAALARHESPQDALHGVLFYLAAYGLMNTGAFGVLMLLPSRERRSDADDDDAAETFEDIAGQGRRRVGLGLAMAVACFSLIGLPLTVGFFGKLFLIRPALQAGMIWLVIVTVVNAAISAAYYLRIVATMFLRPDPTPLTAAADDRPPRTLRPQFAVQLGVIIAVLGTLLFGMLPQATEVLTTRAQEGTMLQRYQTPVAPEDEVAEAP
jgi:NADH-quinone oxidoreductase subunit N